MALNNRHNVFRGEEGRKMWEAVYFSNEEKKELEAMELRGKVQRLENERNTLLEQVKNSKQKVAVPA
jgi:hypothetical protein